ncbi:MAG: universal stress protein [Bdellovibrio bacteriovorus]
MKRFKNILYVAMGDEAGPCALERAATLAENNQAQLTVVSVIDSLALGTSTQEPNLSAGGLQGTIADALQQHLEALVAPWQDRVDISTGVLTGAYDIAVVRDVLRNGRDLVMKCSGGGGLRERLLGMDDLNLLRKCPCPVWLCKPGSPARYRSILVAVDPDDAYPPAELETRHELNLRLLELAAALALSEFAELHVVHVWNAPGETAMRGAFLTTPEEQIRDYVNAEQMRRLGLLECLMDEVAARLGAETLAYLKPVRHLPKGWPRDEIPALAQRIGADLAVLGTVARGGLPGLLMGNTAEILLHHLSCSVLALKPAAFVTLVTL